MPPVVEVDLLAVSVPKAVSHLALEALSAVVVVVHLEVMGLQVPLPRYPPLVVNNNKAINNNSNTIAVEHPLPSRP